MAKNPRETFFTWIRHKFYKKTGEKYDGRVDPRTSETGMGTWNAVFLSRHRNPFYTPVRLFSDEKNPCLAEDDHRIFAEPQR